MNSAHILIINENNEVLIVRRSMDDVWEPNKFAIPGGGIEPGESLIQGIQRETQEEVALTLDPKKILYLADLSKRLNHCFFATNYFNGEVKLRDGEHTEFRWVNPKDLDESICIPNLKMQLELAFKAYNGLKIKIKE